MGIDKYIESAVSNLLKNPIITVLREINTSKILKQSNFTKRSMGHLSYLLLLHLVYMLIMNKRQSAFIRQSGESFGKDVYYRFTQSIRYNWRKLLLISSAALIDKITPLHKKGEHKLLIIDDTVESKRGRQIEGSCRSLWSNKERKVLSGINVVSLNYADSHSTFQIDFAIKMNKSRHKSIDTFAQKLHYASNAHKRRTEGLKGKNILALEMTKRALDRGIHCH
jgi:hypothetical protein